MPSVASWLVLAAWLVFGAVWIVGAFRTARTVRSSLGWDRLILALIVLAVLLLARGGLGLGGFGGRIVPDSPLALALGVLLLYSGLAFAVWARVHLGRFWSGRVALKEGHQLIRSGPYALVRNPIYTGILAMALGSAVALGETGLFLVAAAMLVAFLLKIRAEEKLLSEKFGEEFETYRREVKRLVPGVW